MAELTPDEIPPDLVGVAQAIPGAPSEDVVRAMLAAVLPRWTQERAAHLTRMRRTDCVLCQGTGWTIPEGGSNTEAAKDIWGRFIIGLPRCFDCHGLGIVTAAERERQLADVARPDFARRRPFVT